MTPTELKRAPTGSGRSRRILVTHTQIAPSAIDLLNDNDIDVFFSPPYDPSDMVAARARDLQVDAIMVRLGLDILSLHCPLTAATRNLIDARRLAMMKPTAVIVNTARGGIIDEAAQALALAAKTIAGAALDSFATEPPAADNPLWAQPNLIATPHIGGVTAGSARAMAEIAARHIISVLDGNAPDERSLARPSELAA